MLLVEELSSSNLPQEFIRTLPTHCDICEEPNEITESLTILRCTNKKCPEKAVQRLVTLLADLGVKNMGESKCRKFLENFGTTNPYAIFMYEPDVDGALFDGCSMDFSEDMFEQLDKKRKMLLWEFVRIGNLPGIRDSARHLLVGYEDLEEFYDDLEAGGISFVQSRLSIKGKKTSNDSFFDTDDLDDEDDLLSQSLSIRAVEIYSTLLYFKDELLEAIEAVEIISISTPIINICISTAVGAPYSSKPDFVAKMNDLFSHKIHLNFLKAVTKDCHYLIWSKQGAPTNKAEKAGKYGIPIVTGSEFEAILEAM